MQKIANKHKSSTRRRRIVILFLFLLSHLAMRAQEADTVELKYEVVDTAIQALPAENANDDYVVESTDDTKVETAYFLRKEFTGGVADTLKFRSLPANVIKALREDDAFWYANETFKKKQPKKRNVKFINQPLFQTLLWVIIVGGFATFLILYLHNSNAGLFRRTATIGGEDEADLETSDIFSINYQKEIDKAVNMGNYRLAVRLMFLRVLRTLSDKNLIQYKQDSTNFEYMMQLRATTMYPDFFRLTRNYEYSWYGQFDIDPEKYSIIRNEFENFETRLKR